VKNNIYIYMCVFLLDCIVHILEIINLICLCYFILFFVCCVYFNELIYIYIDLLFFCFFVMFEAKIYYILCLGTSFM